MAVLAEPDRVWLPPAQVMGFDPSSNVTEPVGVAPLVGPLTVAV